MSDPSSVSSTGLPGPRCLGRGKLPLPGSQTQQHPHPGMEEYEMSSVGLLDRFAARDRRQWEVPMSGSGASLRLAPLAAACRCICIYYAVCPTCPSPAPEPLHIDETRGRGPQRERGGDGGVEGLRGFRDPDSHAAVARLAGWTRCPVGMRSIHQCGGWLWWWWWFCLVCRRSPRSG